MSNTVVPKDSGNHSYPRADTPELSSGAFASATSPDNGAAEAFIDAVAERMWQKGAGSGGGSGPIDLRKFRKSNWWVQAVIGVLIAGSGAFAAYKATEARSVSNEEAIRAHEKLPSHPGAQEERRLINVRVGRVDNKVDTIQKQTKSIAKGVESLKIEAQTDKQTRLEEKVKALERENRRLERAR